MAVAALGVHSFGAVARLIAGRSVADGRGWCVTNKECVHILVGSESGGSGICEYKGSGISYKLVRHECINYL